MFKNAIEKINDFYKLDLNKNSHADEMFKVLNEVIQFNSAGILYLAPNKLSLEFENNFKYPRLFHIDNSFSEELYNTTNENITHIIQSILNTDKHILAERLTIKNAVFGIIVIERDKEFSTDEKLIFKTCTKIIANLIKDLELGKVLQLQAEELQNGIIATNKAYETIKKQNKKIKANEKIQNQFIANISHDLRTPLNSIISFSEILGTKLFGELNQKQSQYVEDIKIAGIRLLGMINEILDISKLESGTLKLNISNTDINLLINEVCNILAPLYLKKGLTIIKNIEDDIQIKGDYIKLQQVIFNILGNAIKFSPENGTININAQKTQNNLTISIIDEGKGIDTKYHKKIFNKFFQVEANLSKTETSTGLGLTIAKEFTKLHGGKINVISEQNQGTEFIITIPLEH